MAIRLPTIRYENLILSFLALSMAIAIVYCNQMISFILPIVTLILLWTERGIKTISFQISPPILFFSLLLMWAGISVLWTIHQPAVLKLFSSLTVTFIFAFLFLSCILQASPPLIAKTCFLLKTLGLFLVFLITFQILIDTFLVGFINYQGLAPYMLRMKPTGSILGLTLFGGCALLWTQKNKILSIFMFFFLAIMIALTLCQTAFYGMTLATLVFFLSYFMPFWSTRIGLISVYTFLIFSPGIFSYILSPSLIAESPYLKWILNQSFFHRLLGWEYYSKKFFEKPFLGWGAGSSRYIPTDTELAPGFSHLLHPHNNSIQAYVELGLIGGVLYALFFSSLFFLVEKHVKDRLSVAICNATIIFGFIEAEITHNIWRSYWLSLVVLTTGLIILFLKAREAQLHESTDHLTQSLALSKE